MKSRHEIKVRIKRKKIFLIFQIFFSSSSSSARSTRDGSYFRFSAEMTTTNFKVCISKRCWKGYLPRLKYKLYTSAVPSVDFWLWFWWFWNKKEILLMLWFGLVLTRWRGYQTQTTELWKQSYEDTHFRKQYSKKNEQRLISPTIGANCKCAGTQGLAQKDAIQFHQPNCTQLY